VRRAPALASLYGHVWPPIRAPASAAETAAAATRSLMPAERSTPTSFRVDRESPVSPTTIGDSLPLGKEGG
jgi:hypothetical protein